MPDFSMGRRRVVRKRPLFRHGAPCIALAAFIACGEAQENVADEPAVQQMVPKTKEQPQGSVPVTQSHEEVTVQANALTTIPVKHPARQALSRLTRSQYVHSVEALFGAGAATGLMDVLPELIPSSGYGNSGHAQSQPYNLIVAFDVAAKRVTSSITDWNAIFARYGGCAELSCIGDFVRAFGEAAFRRPLTDAEVEAFNPILTAAEGLSHQETAELLLTAMLQAPEFLYQFESAELDAYQLASRLAFFVTDGPPDAELYALAKDGSLGTEAVLAAQVDRLLESHGTRFAKAFAYDYFSLRKSSQRTFGVAPDLIPALVQSAVQSFAALVASNAPLSEVLTTRTFASNPETAAYVEQPATGTTIAASEAYPFVGLLTHPAVLLAMSNAVEGSTVSRGQFLAGQLLCLPPVPPPPVAFTAEDVKDGLPPNPTPRQEAEARLADPTCGGCHSQFESLAFSLIRWGGDGKVTESIRHLDGGPISTPLGEISFNGYADFFGTLAQSDQFQNCLTDHLLRYGLRHTAYPEGTLDALLESARGSGELTFRTVVKAVVLHELFRRH